MARTVQQQLDAVDALIQELEEAQGLYENGSRSQRMVRERLQALYAERRQLMKDVQTSGAGGGAVFHIGRFKGR